MCTIPLQEWQYLSPEPQSPTFGCFLPQDAAVRSLVDDLAKRGTLTVQELRHGLAVRTSSFVGWINLGDIQIVIQPKIRGMELLRLLRYAYGLRDLSLITPAAAPGLNATTFFDLLVYQLLAECRELISRGLQQQYQPLSERLASPRGRIDLRRVASDGRVREELPCRYHARIQNCPNNQALLSGLLMAVDKTSDLGLRAELRRTAAILEPNVSRVRLDPPLVTRLRRQVNRLTAAYEPVLQLIELLILSNGPVLEGVSRNEIRMPGFLFDMNRFFQRLLGRFLKEYLPDHQVMEEQSIRGMMSYPISHNPRSRRAPAPRPDYSIKTADGNVLYLDAKYRDLWSHELPRDMLYQLSIYALSNQPSRRATILYPTMEDSARDAVVQVWDPTNGNLLAEVIQRPVCMRRLAGLLKPNPSFRDLQRRRALALEMVHPTAWARPLWGNIEPYS